MSVDYKAAVKAGAHNYFIFMWNPQHPENPRMKQFTKYHGSAGYQSIADDGNLKTITGPDKFDWCQGVITKIEYVHRGVTDATLRTWREQQQALRNKAPLVAAPIEAEAVPA